MAKYTLNGKTYCFYQSVIRSIAGQEPMDVFQGRVIGYEDLYKEILQARREPSRAVQRDWQTGLKTTARRTVRRCSLLIPTFGKNCPG